MIVDVYFDYGHGRAKIRLFQVESTMVALQKVTELIHKMRICEGDSIESPFISKAIKVKEKIGEYKCKN